MIKTIASTCSNYFGSNRTQFSFQEVGSGTIPVVLLHGLFGGPNNWTRVMDTLTDHYRFLALQFPIGFGEDHQHTSFKSFGQLTDYVARFLDEVGLDRAVLCGNSLGGQVALDYCMRSPERVEKLVLSGSAGLFERNVVGGRPLRLCRQNIREQISDVFYDEVHVSDEVVDNVFAMLSDRQYRRFLVKVAKASRDRSMAEELTKVKTPTMIIWGRNDSVTPPFVAEEFSDGLHTAELVYIDECGHAPPVERPAEFAHLLHSFLTETSPDDDKPPCKPR